MPLPSIDDLQKSLDVLRQQSLILTTANRSTQSSRSLSIAITNLDTAILWLQADISAKLKEKEEYENGEYSSYHPRNDQNPDERHD